MPIGTSQPAPGTIPAMSYYQPGALTFSGDERVELASSGQATSAVTAQVKITDLVGKAPLNMTVSIPSSNDLVAFFQSATNLPAATQVGNLGLAFGNLPNGGTPGQILNKIGPANFSANWSSIVSFVSADGSTLATSGNATGIVLAVAANAIGSGQLATGGVLATAIATNAVGNAQFRQSAGLSVVGNSGSALANVADITATGGFQVLQVNAGGTGLVFASLGTSSFTGVLTVPQGGTNTSVLGTHAVILGAGTATVQFAAPSTGGNLLIDQGASANPAFTPVAGDITITSAGTTTIGANKVTFAKFQQVGPGTLIGNPTNATANALATTTPVLGTVAFTGSLGLAGFTSGVVTVQPGSGAAGTFNFNLPTSAGVSGQAMVSGGGGANAQSYTSIATGVGWGLTGANATSFSPSISTANPPYGLDAPINLALNASILTGVLTVNFLNNAGGTPTATSPILVGFQNTNATTQTPGWGAVTSALSISTIVGATLGVSTASFPFRYWVVLFYQNATTLMPALINCSNASTIFALNEYNFATTVGMTATSTLAGTFYSPSGTTANNLPFRIAGFLEYNTGLTTNGTYSTLPTAIKLLTVGTKKPGDYVQSQFLINGAGGSTNSTTIVSVPNTIATLTPSSQINPIWINYNFAAEITAGGSATNSQSQYSLARNGATVGILYTLGNTSGAGTNLQLQAAQTLNFIESPATTAALGYNIFQKSTLTTATAVVSGVYGSIVELMG